MTTPNYLMGKSAVVTIGSTTYRFSKIKIAMRVTLVDVTNFLSAGSEEYAAAVQGCDLTLSQTAYDQGNNPWALGTTYSVVFTFCPSVTLAIPFIVASIDVEIDIKGAQGLTLAGKSNGTFTGAVT
jgi:hypothetical protein